MKYCLMLLIALLTGNMRAQQVGIGEWDSYFTLTNMYDVVEGPGGKIFWVSELSALYYDPSDYSVTELNKIDGLTQTGFTALAYNANTQTIILAYNDGNIDLLNFDANNKVSVVNMSDIKRASLTGDKKIYSLYSYNNYVYVSCGFGIVVIDMVNREVKDTYIIGNASTQIKVNGVAIGEDTIYAATESGIYKAWSQNAFLNYYTAWSKMTSLPAWLIDKPFKAPCHVLGRLYAIPDYPLYGQDTMYYRDAGTWHITPVLQGSDFNKVLSRGSDLVLSCYQNVGIYTTSFGIIDNLYQYNTDGGVRLNGGIVASNNLYYVADDKKGPVQCVNSYAYTSLLPGGTRTSSVRRLAGDADQLWVAPGHVEGTIFLNTFNTDFFSVKEGNTWTYINRDTDPMLMNNVYDVLDVTIDPTDPTHVMAAAWSLWGLVEIKDKKVTAIWDETNTDFALFSPAVYPDFCGVASVLYDKDGNLWCLNGQANKPLVVKTADGQWKNFYLGPQAAERTYFDLAIDENGYKYVPVPTRGAGAGGLAVYNDNGTIMDESDDQYYFYQTLAGLGNLPDGDVRCVTIDLDGEAWVGTTKGPCVIYNPTNIFAGANADAQRILIEQDGNTQILLETEIINCIEVDGANRKWIGTENSGVFLLSEDGIKEVFHFTQENSPLPSNSILDIEINGKTGEVYFATANGLISYRGTATESALQFTETNVFPNPVRPGYTGLIAINGLSRNSDVKVTDIAGNIVNVVKSEGGQATWDGNNLKGQRVKPGVYMFMCSKEDGTDKVAGKVMILE